jgi:uncharacterized membrane protein
MLKQSWYNKSMKKIITSLLPFLVFIVLLVVPTFAQDNHTAREEKEGKVIWEKLQAKQINCDTLTDEDYERLGEYYMGRTVGDSHESMNTMMERMMGKEGEEQMHVVMGKRLSGCETVVEFPNQGRGFMPMMMNMMTGSAFAPQSFGETKGGVSLMMGYGGWNNMMGGWGGFGLLASLFWIVILVDLILLGVFLWKKITKDKK